MLIGQIGKWENVGEERRGTFSLLALMHNKQQQVGSKRREFVVSSCGSRFCPIDACSLGQCDFVSGKLQKCPKLLFTLGTFKTILD